MTGRGMKRHSRYNKQQNNKGFSLVEVLVAMAILSILALPLLETFSNSARVNSRARREENANTAASDIVEVFKGMGKEELEALKQLEAGTASDNCTLGGYTYQSISSPSDSEVDGTGTGVYTYEVSNAVDGTASYYKGINNEKFYVQACINPSLYTDGSKGGNANNNINSYAMPAYSNLSSDENYVLRNELYRYDSAAIANFQYLAGSDYSKKHMGKLTEIMVDVRPDTSDGNKLSENYYVQTVSIRMTYSYYKNQINGRYEGRLMSEEDKVYPDYVQTIVLPANSFKGYKEAAVGSSDKPKVSSVIADNLKNIYIFYMPFDDYSTANYSDATGNAYSCTDRISISYTYGSGTGAGLDSLATVYSDCNVYLIEQEKKSAVNPEYIMHLNKGGTNNNVVLSVNSDVKNPANSGTLNLSGETPTGALGGAVSVYSNIAGWNTFKLTGDTRDNGVTSGNMHNASDELYTLSVTVWYKNKDSDSIVARIITTKSNW